MYVWMGSGVVTRGLLFPPYQWRATFLKFKIVFPKFESIFSYAFQIYQIVSDSPTLFCKKIIWKCISVIIIDTFWIHCSMFISQLKE